MDSFAPTSVFSDEFEDNESRCVKDGGEPEAAAAACEFMGDGCPWCWWPVVGESIAGPLASSSTPEIPYPGAAPGTPAMA